MNWLTYKAWWWKRRLHAGASAAALDALRARTAPRLAVEITAWWSGVPEERRWRRGPGEALLAARLLMLPEADLMLAKAVAAVRSGAPLEFAVHCVRACLVAEPPTLLPSDLPNTLEVLGKLAQRSAPPLGGPPLAQLVEQVCRA